MSGYIAVPENGYYIPSTLGTLQKATERECQVACNALPTCLGITLSTEGFCKFLQMSDLSKLGTANAPNNPIKENTALNCANLCPGFTGCSPQKVLGISYNVWLVGLSLALAAMLLYTASLSFQLNSARGSLRLSDLALANSA